MQVENTCRYMGGTELNWRGFPESIFVRSILDFSGLGILGIARRELQHTETNRKRSPEDHCAVRRDATSFLLATLEGHRDARLLRQLDTVAGGRLRQAMRLLVPQFADDAGAINDAEDDKKAGSILSRGRGSALGIFDMASGTCADRFQYCIDHVGRVDG